MSTTITVSDQQRSRSRRELRPCLVVAHHAKPGYVGARVVLTANEPVAVGRGGLAFGAGVLDDPQISRKHARITLDDAGSTHVSDEGSHNGTLVNGARIERAELHPGDVIGVGGMLLLLIESPAIYTASTSARLVGSSYAIAEVVGQIEQVAPHATTVLVLGETGSGKELVARELHDRSGRRGPFVAINCGGVDDGVLQAELFGCMRGAFSGADRDRPGVVEAAHGGTLFLDEIGDSTPALQRSLLRVLQEGTVRRVGSTTDRPVDVRFVAATHRDLDQMLRDGSFREDLYARLSGWVVHVPALRDRREDIPTLVRHFLDRAAPASQKRLGASLALRLLRHEYPRNVRELQKLVERAAIEAGAAAELQLTESIERLLCETGPEQVQRVAPSRVKARSGNKRPTAAELEAQLAAHQGNVTHLAAALGVGRNTLYRWLKEAGLERTN